MRALRWLAAVALLGGLSLNARAAWALSPEETVRAHFAALQAKEFTSADQYFSAAFLAAFKPEVAKLNEYYLARLRQLGPGYNITETIPLQDEDRQTARVAVEFNDPRQDAVVQLSERMYYYLVREKVEPGAPGRDAEGQAWRIDIYDALSYDSLADARRRPYLATKDAWPEDEGRELRSKQGFFRIQWALNDYFEREGQYPDKLRGADDRRDPLIKGGFLFEAYPVNGFSGGAMAVQEFEERSSGDFAYYPIDADGDGAAEDYWLLLHGKVEENYYFDGYDIVYIANSGQDGSQAELAQRYGIYWLEQQGDELLLTSAVAPFGDAEPSSMLPPAGTVAELQSRPQEEGDSVVDEEVLSQDSAAPLESEQPSYDGTHRPTIAVSDVALLREERGERGRVVTVYSPKALGELIGLLSMSRGSELLTAWKEAQPPVKLRVHSYGW
jgi:hypothetical protein